MPRYPSPDGLGLHYTDEGEGLPLLCLAGLTRTGGDFDYLAPHLPPLRLIRPDYRGRGRSDRAADPMTYTVAHEARDVIALLDHLGIGRAAILGTSRGGIIGMMLAATAKDRLLGLCLNDVGPVIAQAGLERIFGYLGRPPAARTIAEAARAMPRANPGFDGVPAERWEAEAQRFFNETADGLELRYDPALRQPFLAAFDGPPQDLWPLFDACAGLPLALIRGANSDLLDPTTVEEMRRRRPDMIHAEVPGRAHVPFLDEPQSLAAIHAWLERME
jgi:pimeloyl-ACP methyl ester carboxylesterase